MKRFLLIGVFLLTTFIGFRMPSSQAQTKPTNCDDNSVISCGAYTKSELKDGWSAHAGVQCLYTHFGISQADVRNIDSNSVDGTVTKSGNVVVNGKIVATDAMTAGRTPDGNNASTPYTCAGQTFYMRSPSVSFNSNSLSAFVVMDSNDRFSFAIINSCGNPVMATPVAPKTIKPAATQPVKPATVPVPQAPPTVVVTTPAPSQTQSQTQTQTVNVTPPAVAAATTTQTQTTPTQQQTQTQPAPAPAATKAIPNTGPGDVLKIFGLASTAGTFGHWFYARRRTA